MGFKLNKRNLKETVLIICSFLIFGISFAVQHILGEKVALYSTFNGSVSNPGSTEGEFIPTPFGVFTFGSSIYLAVLFYAFLSKHTAEVEKLTSPFHILLLICGLLISVLDAILWSLVATIKYNLNETFFILLRFFIMAIAALVVSFTAFLYWGRKNERSLFNKLLDCAISAEADPNFYPAHYNIGVLYQGSGKFNDAVAFYQKALKIKPDYAEAYNNLGITLQVLGRLDECKASLKQAIALKPDYADAHYNLGVTHHELGKLEEAQASYTQAIALMPNYAEAHYNLGNTHKELGRLEEAKASYTQAITLNPDLAEAHYNLGVTHKELGRLDEAEASYTQAIALNPDCAETHRGLGVTLQALGRLDEAEASYTQAIALKPDCAKAHRSLTLMKTFDAQDEQYLKMVEL